MTESARRKPKVFCTKKLYVRNENTRQSVPIVHFVLVFLLQIARFKWVDGNTSTIPPQSFYYQPCPGGVSCSVRCGFRSCIYTTLVSGGLCLLAMALPSAESWFHQSWFKWKRWRIKARYYRVSTKSCICPAQIQGREKKSLEFEQIELFGEKKSQPWFGYVICLSCSDLFFLQVGLRPLVKSYHRVGGPSEPNEIEIIIKKNI